MKKCYNNKTIGGPVCYNSCSHFSFNPMTGEDKCTLKKGETCPMDEEETTDEEEGEPCEK